MSHIVLLPFGSAGDVFPFIWLGRQLLARGHRVTMITACLFDDAARKAGVDFIGLGTKEEFEALQRDRRIWKPYRATQLVFQYAGERAVQFRDAVRALARSEAPALMLAPLTAFGARLAREELGIPLVTVHLQPSVLVSMHDTPVYFMGARWMSRLPRWVKRLLFSLPNPADQCALPAIRRACLAAGVPPPRSLWREWWHSPDGVLLLFPDWFAAPQPDWPANRLQHTFPLEDLSSEQPLSAELQAFLAAGEKPIVFTPGSANVQAHEFFQAALDAVQMLGRRAVFVTRDLSQLPGALPPAVFAEAFVPFSPLLRHAAAFVHHGGIGTLSQGLAAGVPQLLMPMAHDQPDNESRLRRLGAGFGLPPRKFTAPRVAAALQRLLSDVVIVESCRAVRERLRSGSSIESLLSWLEAKACPQPRSA